MIRAPRVHSSEHGVVSVEVVSDVLCVPIVYTIVCRFIRELLVYIYFAQTAMLSAVRVFN